jgi:hypothetical protein
MIESEKILKVEKLFALVAGMETNFEVGVITGGNTGKDD